MSSRAPAECAILIVEDDAAIRRLVRMVLERIGYKVDVAADGVEAVLKMGLVEFDVIVLDLMMPNLDGFGLLKAMRDTGLADTTRTVILTCKVDDADVVRGLELGAHEYLGKPFDPDRLAGVLRRVLDSTAEALADRRRAQLDKAALRDRIEAALARPRRRAGSFSGP